MPSLNSAIDLSCASMFCSNVSEESVSFGVPATGAPAPPSRYRASYICGDAACSCGWVFITW